MKTTEKIQQILKTLPSAPGIYKMIDQEGRVIYVGKAKDLCKRIKQYFKKDYQHSTRTRKLIENVTNIETITVDSEIEALLLENNLIKQLQPKYNILLKDDKNYVYIKITREDFPRIQIVRQIEKDNSKYIGPKTAAHKVKDSLKLLKKLFPFRHCGLDIEFVKENPISSDGKAKHEVKITRKVIKYPCLDYYIKRCVAPCIGCCKKEEYAQIIENVENFLEGKTEQIIKNLYEEMRILAEKKEFEKAGRLRDKIKKIEDILEKQKVQDSNQQNKDIINYCITQGNAYFNLFQIRDGKLLGQENFILRAEEIEEDQNQEVLTAFLQQYYEIATDIPKEILIPHQIENQKELELLIMSSSERKIKFIIPKIGDKNKLLEMSAKNARIFADRNKASWQEENETTKSAAEDLQKLLNLKNPLKRIECYDISHLSGTDTVGSMIVFINGIPSKDHYRKFQIRSVVDKPDDFKCMEEVLTRRFSKLGHQISQREYKVRKASKKDKNFLEKHNQTDLQNFYILEKEKISIGFIALQEYTDKIAELKNLWINEEHRGHKLGYKLIKEVSLKTKAKRIYVFIKENFKDYYSLAGFDEIKKIPEELNFRYSEIQKTCDCEPLTVALDKIKLKEDKSFSQIPDLVIIDGGKGQLSSATKVFEKLNLKIPYISLAKRLEEIFIPGENLSMVLEKNNEALKLLQRTRDEAHRFAISYNRNLRGKRMKS